MSDNTVVLITGSNRGIGLGFTKTYLARPNHTVIAAVRDPSKAKEGLESITPASNSSIILVRIDYHDRASIKSAIEEIQQKGVNHLDIVIANAGLSNPKGFGSTNNFDVDVLSEHFDINTTAPIALYQATRPLLAKSRAQNGPQFVPISSLAGSINRVGVAGLFDSYGASKTALNMLFARAHEAIVSMNESHREIKFEESPRVGEEGVAPYELVVKDREDGMKDRLAIVIFHPG